MIAQDTLRDIEIWHERARPEPTAENFSVQLGCHFEEICEMLTCLHCSDERLLTALEALDSLSLSLKAGNDEVGVIPNDRADFLDSLADQIVTAVGVGHCANMDVTEACKRVNKSNWSKFVDGQPAFNDAGKIAKGPDYAPPDLRGLV